MKLGFRMTAVAVTIALQATLAHGEDAFAPYSEDYTRGEPIPPEMLKNIEHAKPLLSPVKKDEPRASAARSRTPRRNADAAVATPVQATQGAPLPKSGF